MKFPGFDGFVLEMPTGDERPPHLVVVGTAAEIRWLVDQRAAKKSEAGHGGTDDSRCSRERH